MIPLIIACDTPGLKAELAAAYARPPTYHEAPAPRVPDQGATTLMVAFLLIGLIILKLKSK